MRVHELAKALDLSSKEVIAKLAELGVSAKSHMSAVDDDAVQLLEMSRSPDKTAAPEKAPAKKEDVAAPPEETPQTKADEGVLSLRGPIVVKDLARGLNLRPNQLVAELMSMNVFASINDRLEVKVAQAVAEKHGVVVDHERKTADHKPVTKAVDEEEQDDSPEDLLPRPPVVAFLGHVDHGKTSLLDRIRNAAVARGEAGGITQHIGAYQIEHEGQQITFLDTPGHEAFTAMRARGADLTDIAVIVIASDDGIMPQTKEAIKHVQAAGAAVVVAINKMDLPSANADMVRQQLSAEGLASEAWGGETICCEVSAETGAGMDNLLGMILLQAEMLELKANPGRRASGFVIEAKLEAGMGPTANLLVKKGTLKVGDALLCGRHYGRVKALIDDHGRKVKKAGPSVPVSCLGLSGVPEAGAGFRVCANDRAAKILAQEALAEIQEGQRDTAPKKASLEGLYEQLAASEKLELKLVLKTDVRGSLEAIANTLERIKSDKVSLNLILSGVGNITVNDTLLASASDAVVVGFNVAKENGVNAAAKREGVEIRLHSVIYELADEIRESMTGLLAPKLEETVIGHAEIKELFSITKVGKIAGCLVTDGRVTSKSRVRVKRADDVIYEGSVNTLKRFQNDAAEVRESQECGIRLENFVNFEKGDIIESYEVAQITQEL